MPKAIFSPNNRLTDKYKYLVGESIFDAQLS
jgi:hypothetical protein